MARRPHPSLRCLARLQDENVNIDAIAVVIRCAVLSGQAEFLSLGSSMELRLRGCARGVHMRARTHSSLWWW